MLNKTRVSTELLKNLCTHAAKIIGAKEVPVKVTQGRSPYSTGYARHNGFFRNCEIKVILPKSIDTLQSAEQFYATLLHEYAHIKDYQLEQSGTHLAWATKGPNHNRGKWENRPQEQRAIKATKSALLTNYPDDLILDLALELQ